MKQIKAEHKMMLAALLCGLAAAVLAYAAVDAKEKSIVSSMDPVKVIFAAKYMPRGVPVEASYLEFREMPRRLVTGAHVTEFSGIKGMITIAPFVKGEPVLANKLADKGGEIETSIPTGLRAISVEVNEASGVGYMIKPGAYVDVLLTYEKREGKEAGTITSTILQAVRVVAVGSDVTSAGKNKAYNSVTLALMPEEAEILAFSKERGRINFALRALGDREKEKIKEVDFNSLQKQIKKTEKGSEPAASLYRKEPVKAAREIFPVKRRETE